MRDSSTCLCAKSGVGRARNQDSKGRESGTTSVGPGGEDYKQRSIEPLIVETLRELPAALIVGPRATGKTTAALRHVASVVRLDRSEEAEIFRADPDAALRGLAEPVFLDEWQDVPDVLGAVKRAVDTDARPGRFLLTGSVRDDLRSSARPGTGRVVRLTMFGMTIAEQLGRPGVVPLVDRLVRAEPLAVPADPPDIRGYVELGMRSGFPRAALWLSAGARMRWIAGYIDQLLTRDAVDLRGLRDPDRLRRYFEAFALNTAGVVDDLTLYEAAAIDRKTALAYEQLLANLLVVERLPAWTSNRMKRLIRSPKRYIIDPALAAGTLRLDATAIARDGNLLGRFLDSFVAAQLRADAVRAETQPRMYHLRQRQGRHEIDMLAEIGGHRLIGIEVKAGATVTRADAKHLSWLRDEVGDRFVAGVVLHTGSRVHELDDRIVAAPIATLWT